MTTAPKIGDVVQLTTTGGAGWANELLMIVEEVRTWGVTGFIPTPQGEAPMRASFKEIKTIWHRVPDG